MNIVLWLMAGGLAGWIGLRYLRANRTRGMVVSILIGMGGGLLGGTILAPMFGDISANPGAFSPFSLFIALASATACLTIGNMLHRHYRI